MAIERQDLVDYLRKSVALQDPDVETDPAFQFSDDDLEDILDSVLYANFTGYTLTTVPKSGEYTLLLLSRKEIYWRLATSTAPFYPLSVEGIDIQKNYRFDHYLNLINTVQKEWEFFIESNKDTDNPAVPGSAATILLTTKDNVGEVILPSRHFTTRNYNLFDIEPPTLTKGTITSDSAELTWSKYQVGRFSKYKVYIHTETMVDPFTVPDIEAYKVEEFTDIHRVKYRFTGLTSATNYYCAVAVVDQNGRIGYTETSFTTL